MTQYSLRYTDTCEGQAGGWLAESGMRKPFAVAKLTILLMLFTERADMELAIGFSSLGIALVAAVIAVWQGILSKSQLKLATETQGKTEAALDEIRTLTRESKALAESIKSDIDTRINTILDMRNENERQSNAMSNQAQELFLKQMFGGMNIPGAGREQGS